MKDKRIIITFYTDSDRYKGRVTWKENKGIELELDSWFHSGNYVKIAGQKLNCLMRVLAEVRA